MEYQQEQEFRQTLEKLNQVQKLNLLQDLKHKVSVLSEDPIFVISKKDIEDMVKSAGGQLSEAEQGDIIRLYDSKYIQELMFDLVQADVQSKIGGGTK